MWKIYYDNGDTFTSEQGTPWDAPRTGVIAIVHTNAQVGWEIVHAYDYFYYEEKVGGWRASDQFGMYDHLIRCKNPLILFGRMTDDESYHFLLKRIREEMGDKSGWIDREIRRGA